jgi:cytochrome c biogenesis protein CcmG/thiol:disulfide interchange protein DsbE
MKFFVGCFLLIALFSCTAEKPAENSKADALNQKQVAPDFDLENIAGGRLKAADVKNQVTIVDIWATWCAPCISEIPKFNKLQDEYRAKGVRIVGITVMSPYGDIRPKSKEYGIDYTVVVGNDDVVDGFGGVIGWPTTFVITKDWRIYRKYIGALPDKEARMRADIEKLLSAS